MVNQVYLNKYQHWADVIGEENGFLLARGPNGEPCLSFIDKNQRTRDTEDEKQKEIDRLKLALEEEKRKLFEEKTKPTLPRRSSSNYGSGIAIGLGIGLAF